MEASENTWLFVLNIVGQAKIHAQDNNYKVKIENELKFIENLSSKDESIFQLTELNYELLEYQDPVAKQIVEMTNMLGVIYEKILFGVDKYGRLTRLLNIKEIRSKWEKVKEKLIKDHPLMSFDIIRAKEFELSNMDMELRNLQYIHFLHTYFLMHGRIEKDGYFEINEMDRFGNGVVIPVGMVYSHRKTEDNTMVSKFRGRFVKKSDSVSRLRKAISDNQANLSYKLDGKNIYENGFFKQAELVLEERIGEHYFTHNYITLKEYNNG